MLKCSTFLLKVSRRVLGQFALVTHLIIWKMAPKSKLLLSNLEDGHYFDQASLQWKMDPLNSEFISSNSCCNSCLITFRYVLKNWRNINWPNEVLGNWCLNFFCWRIASEIVHWIELKNGSISCLTRVLAAITQLCGCSMPLTSEPGGRGAEFWRGWF